MKNGKTTKLETYRVVLRQGLGPYGAPPLGMTIRVEKLIDAFPKLLDKYGEVARNWVALP